MDLTTITGWRGDDVAVDGDSAETETLVLSMILFGTTYRSLFRLDKSVHLSSSKTTCSSEC